MRKMNEIDRAEEIDKAYKRIEELDNLMDERLIVSCSDLIDYLDEEEQEEYHRLQELVSSGENFKQKYLDGFEQICNNMMTIGQKLIREVKNEYQEFDYITAMRSFHNKVYRIIEDEFDIEVV